MKEILICYYIQRLFDINNLFYYYLSEVLVSYEDVISVIDGTSGDVNAQIRFPSNLSYIVNLVPGVITPYYGSWPSIAHLDLIFSNLNEESHAIAKVLKIKLELSTQDTKLSSVHGSQIDEEKYTFSLLGPEVHYGNQNVSILADTGIC